MPRKAEVYRERSVARLLEQCVEEGLEAAGGDPRRSARTRELVRTRLKPQPAR